MLRGFRWQLLIFALASLVFIAAIIFHVGQSRQVGPPAKTVTATAPPTLTATDIAPAPIASTPENAQRSNPRRQYREALVGEVKRLNPIFAHLNAVDQDITSLIFEGLFAANSYGAPIPRLAENLTISRDDLEYVVALRQDIRWQDGVAFDADDVVYTMSLLSDAEYGRYSSSAGFWRSVETQKLSEYLLRFRLAQPLASFPSYLTIGILPEHALRGTTVARMASHPFNLSPIGTGPYQVDELRVDGSGKISAVQLAFSPVYRERIGEESDYQIKELLFRIFMSADEAIRAYQSHVVDALANVGERQQLLDMPQSLVFTSHDSPLVILIFNWERPRFQDRRLRRALALSVDQNTLTELHFPGAASPADSPFIPGMAVYRPGAFWRRYDPAQAAALIASAADTETSEQSSDEEEESESLSKSVILLVEDSSGLVGMASDIAEEWGALGLDVEVAAHSSDEMVERLRGGDFDAAIVSQRIGGDPDVYRFWHPAQYEAGRNYGHVSHSAITELLDSARMGRDGIARFSMHQEFQEAFAEQAIAVPLFYPLYTIIVRDSIDGIRLGYLGTAADRFRGIGSWKFSALPD